MVSPTGRCRPEPFFGIGQFLQGCGSLFALAFCTNESLAPEAGFRKLRCQGNHGPCFVDGSCPTLIGDNSYLSISRCQSSFLRVSVAVELKGRFADRCVSDRLEYPPSCIHFAQYQSPRRCSLPALAGLRAFFQLRQITFVHRWSELLSAPIQITVPLSESSTPWLRLRYGLVDVRCCAMARLTKQQVPPLRIQKGTNGSSPNKMPMVAHRPLSELSPMALRRNSPSFPQAKVRLQIHCCHCQLIWVGQAVLARVLACWLVSLQQ